MTKKIDAIIDEVENAAESIAKRILPGKCSEFVHFYKRLKHYRDEALIELYEILGDHLRERGLIKE